MNWFPPPVWIPPPVRSLEVLVNGEKHRGSWYLLLGQVVVNYHGHTRSLAADPRPSQELLETALRELVEAHYLSIDAIPEEWPAALRSAAYRYVSLEDDECSLDDLIEALGIPQPRNHPYLHIAWLCLNAVGVIVPSWKLMCDSDQPEQTYRELRAWMGDVSNPVDWEKARSPAAPLRDGAVIVDQDACRAEPIANAVAATAGFLRTAEVRFAINALISAGTAHDEGCRPQDSFISFEHRLVLALLPAALQCRLIDE